MIQQMQKYLRVLVYIWRKGYDAPTSHEDDELQPNQQGSQMMAKYSSWDKSCYINQPAFFAPRNCKRAGYRVPLAY